MKKIQDQTIYLVASSGTAGVMVASPKAAGRTAPVGGNLTPLYKLYPSSNNSVSLRHNKAYS